MKNLFFKAFPFLRPKSDAKRIQKAIEKNAKRTQEVIETLAKETPNYSNKTFVLDSKSPFRSLLKLNSIDFSASNFHFIVTTLGWGARHLQSVQKNIPMAEENRQKTYNKLGDAARYYIDNSESI